MIEIAKDSEALHTTVRQEDDRVTIRIPMAFRMRSGRREVILPNGIAPTIPDAYCPLKTAVARAHRWQKMIETGEVASNSDLARRLKMDQSLVARTIRLASLAPDMIESILDGDEPDGLSLKMMRRELPLLWQEQKEMLCAEEK